MADGVGGGVAEIAARVLGREVGVGSQSARYSVKEPSKRSGIQRPMLHCVLYLANPGVSRSCGSAEPWSSLASRQLTKSKSSS